MDRDESFIWKLEASAAPDTSDVGDTSKVVGPDTSGTTDTSTTRILLTRDIQLQTVPTRTFDLKGRSVRPQPLGRNRETYRKLFSK